MLTREVLVLNLVMIAWAVGAEVTTAPGAADHWAYKPIARSALPAVDDPAWVKSPIDRFILEGLTAADLAPSAEADRRALIRRVYFDLIGLPPTYEEVQAF